MKKITITLSLIIAFAFLNDTYCQTVGETVKYINEKMYHSDPGKKSLQDLIKTYNKQFDADLALSYYDELDVSSYGKATLTCYVVKNGKRSKSIIKSFYLKGMEDYASISPKNNSAESYKITFWCIEEDCIESLNVKEGTHDSQSYFTISVDDSDYAKKIKNAFLHLFSISHTNKDFKNNDPFDY